VGGTALVLLVAIAMSLIAVVFHVYAANTTISNSFAKSATPQIKHHRSIINRKNIPPSAAKAEQVAAPPASSDSMIQPPPSSPMPAALMVPTQELHPHYCG
jgi:hypothetical protein